MNEICVYKINTRAGKLSFNPASTYLQGKQLWNWTQPWYIWSIGVVDRKIIEIIMESEDAL